jgi:hypothetical protein
LRSKPANLTLEEAAALPVSGCTVLQAVRDQGKVTAVHGQDVDIDWRVPSLLELMSLVDYGRDHPVADPTVAAGAWGRLIGWRSMGWQESPGVGLRRSRSSTAFAGRSGDVRQPKA